MKIFVPGNTQYNTVATNLTRLITNSLTLLEDSLFDLVDRDWTWATLEQAVVYFNILKRDSSIPKWSYWYYGFGGSRWITRSKKIRMLQMHEECAKEAVRAFFNVTEDVAVAQTCRMMFDAMHRLYDQAVQLGTAELLQWKDQCAQALCLAVIFQMNYEFEHFHLTCEDLSWFEYLASQYAVNKHVAKFAWEKACKANSVLQEG